MCFFLFLPFALKKKSLVLMSPYFMLVSLDLWGALIFPQ
jgi:hypothetical protein